MLRLDLVLYVPRSTMKYKVERFSLRRIGSLPTQGESMLSLIGSNLKYHSESSNNIANTLKSSTWDISHCFRKVHFPGAEFGSRFGCYASCIFFLDSSSLGGQGHRPHIGDGHPALLWVSISPIVFSSVPFRKSTEQRCNLLAGAWDRISSLR